MGWWSADIMGGDTPLDIQDYLFEIFGVERNYEDAKKDVIPAEAFEYIKIMEYFGKRKDTYWLNGDTGRIFHQVLGVLMMKVGAPIDDTLKAKMIKAAENDEWANEDGEEERKQRMDSFIKALNEYDGTPFVINSAGLFDKLAVHMAVTNKPSVEDLRGLLLAHVEDYRQETVNTILDKIIEKSKTI